MPDKPNPDAVPSLRVAKVLCRREGVWVNTVPRTGEVKFHSPLLNHSVRVNNRRKDSVREVQTLLKRHVEERTRMEREGSS